jgi:hypothetical protein
MSIVFGGYRRYNIRFLVDINLVLTRNNKFLLVGEYGRGNSKSLVDICSVLSQNKEDNQRKY